MRSFQPNRVYLAAWDITRDFPRLSRDVAALHALWSSRSRHAGGGAGAGARAKTRLYAGPSLTVTGLHAHGRADTLACQLRGVKEWLLFAPEHGAAMRDSRKYGFGSTMSEIDITDLGARPAALRAFERARGAYARAEPGDVLYLPAGTWHAAVAAEPSLTVSSSCARNPGPCAALTDAAASAAHEWRAARGGGGGWCVCHETRDIHAMMALQQPT
jgi:lysine-specific demethylase 8